MPAPPVVTELADTYPNPSNAVFRTGIAKLYNYAKGLLGSTGDAAEARDALGIGPVISNRNLIINGAFSQNQGGVSGTVVLGAGSYGHDQWKAGAGGCTYTFSTTGINTTITITAGTLVQPIEGSGIEGGNYVMSWSGTAQGKIGAGSFGATGVAATGVTGGTNLNVEFGTGTLTRVQFERGTLATPYERRLYGTELALCQRYYQRLNQGAGAEMVGVGFFQSAVMAFIPIKFPPMRAAPTISAPLGTYTCSNGSSNYPVSNLTASSASNQSALLNATVSGAPVVNAPCVLAGTASILELNARLP